MYCFFNDTATTEIYTLSLHDALPILPAVVREGLVRLGHLVGVLAALDRGAQTVARVEQFVHQALGHRLLTTGAAVDRKSTRLNSSHANISYAVFCLKKKTQRARVTRR